MKKYIIVYHYWFVNHIAWETQEVVCNDEEEAYNIAINHKYNTEDSLNECQFNVTEIANNERINKLTWKERLLGKIL